MNTVRLGLVVRALRRRLGWRQTDLAIKAGVSQQAISRLERGFASTMSLESIRRVLAALGADLDLVVRWRGGELDRLLDSRHADLSGRGGALLAGLAWEVLPEVSYSEYGERGAIDLLAISRSRHLLLVVEVKTELISLESTLRKHDEKVRLAAGIARKRFGLHGTVEVLRLLVLPDSGAARRRVAEHGAVLDRVYPVRGRAIRPWLRSTAPAQVGGIVFLPLTRRVSGGRELGGPHRVRRSVRNVTQARTSGDEGSPAPPPAPEPA